MVGSLAFMKKETGIGCSCQSGSACDHVELVIFVSQLPGMMDDDQTDIMVICEFLQQTNVIIVTGLAVGIFIAFPDFSQGIDDDQLRSGVIQQEAS